MKCDKAVQKCLSFSKSGNKTLYLIQYCFRLLELLEAFGLAVGMGCTPSIHVNQTGVVYCRDSDESNSPRGSYSATIHTHIIKTDSSEVTSISRPISPGKQKRKDCREKEVSTTSNNAVETQTTSVQMKVFRVVF